MVLHRKSRNFRLYNRRGQRSIPIFRRHNRVHRTHSNESTIIIAASDQALALWVFAFAISHIGLSAVRTSIISSFATAADTLNLANNENWRLPDWWPGDGANGE